ncbi:MAG: GntR family transcriptional regulator [Clostridiaceae bacterium]|nr:GntR family transcriptional regulator [Clostridiaceae bacterium]
MINRESPTPLYVQLEEIIEKAIKNGEYKDGDRLPSENKLCSKYGVSRITVRQALKLLEQKGLVYTVHGKGTFVKEIVIDQYLYNVVNFGKILLKKGLDGHTKISSFYPNNSNKNAEIMFGAEASDQIANLNLIGYIIKTPAVYYQSFVNTETGQKLYQWARKLEMEGAAFSTYDLYFHLGTSIEKIEQKITAIKADKTLSKILEIPAGSPLLVLESKLYTSEGTPLEYKLGYYRSDKFAFYLNRKLA